MTKKSSAAKKATMQDSFFQRVVDVSSNPKRFRKAVASALRSARGRPYFVLAAIDKDDKFVAVSVVEGTLMPNSEVAVRFPVIPSRLRNHPKTAKILAMPLHETFCGWRVVQMDESREKTGTPTERFRLVSVK